MVIWWNDNVREFFTRSKPIQSSFRNVLYPGFFASQSSFHLFSIFSFDESRLLMALCNFPHSRHLFPSPEAIPSIWQLNSSQPPKFLPCAPSPPPYNANHATSHQSNANYDRRKIIERRHRTVGFTQSIRGTMNPAIVGDIDIHWEETYWRKARG